MNARQPILAVLLLLIFSTIASAQVLPRESNFALGFSTGYNRGLGFQITATALQPLENVPVQIRIGIGLTTSMNPGNSADARRIFINNATNGVPEEKARSFDYRLDFMIDSDFINSDASKIVFGPRYSSFKANFKYIGGNENFDVTSKQIGLGLGYESQFKISSKLNLLAAVGLDYFFNSTLTGHDTSYSPDDDNVNPRNDNTNDNVEFTFKDANEAIKQPTFMPRVLIGVVYML
jgi:hypothetical protein